MMFYFNGQRIEIEYMQKSIASLFWQFNHAEIIENLSVLDIHPIYPTDAEISKLRKKLEMGEVIF